jgi:hypothetical protein
MYKCIGEAISTQGRVYNSPAKSRSDFAHFQPKYSAKHFYSILMLSSPRPSFSPLANTPQSGAAPEPFFTLHGIEVQPIHYRDHQRYLKEAYQALAEFVGTWFFVYCGVGAINSGFAVDWLRVNNGQVSLEPGAKLTSSLVTMIAFSFGMSLMVMIFAFYRFSGGVFNPAVGLSLWLMGCMTTSKFVMYFVAQILGAIVAVAWCIAFFPVQKPGVVHTFSKKN